MLSWPTRRTAWLAVFLALASPPLVHAEDQGYYAAVGVEVDDADLRSLQGQFAVPFGESGWVQLDLGNTSSSGSGADEQDVDMTSTGVSFGFSTGKVEWLASYTHREDGSSYTQDELSGGLTYVATRGSIGLDLFYRDADFETVTSIERRFRDPLSIRITESTQGTGLGAHGDWFVSDALMLSIGGMVYDYDTTADFPPRLTRSRRVSLSGLTREQAYLKDSTHAGASYQFDLLSIGASYYRDREVDGGLVTDAAELYADFPIGTHWTIAVWVGRAATEDEPGSTYGGAQLSVSW